MSFLKFKKNSNFKYGGGFSLVEAIVAVSIALASIIGLWQIYTFFIKISLSNPSFFQASFLAEEGVEAVKFLRDSGYSSNIKNISTTTAYYLSFTGTGWATSTAASLIDGRFDRQVRFADVYRDAFGNISDVGNIDQNTKKVTVTVSWPKDGATSTREITTYVSNLFEN